MLPLGLLHPRPNALKSKQTVSSFQRAELILEFEQPNDVDQRKKKKSLKRPIEAKQILSQNPNMQELSFTAVGPCQSIFKDRLLPKPLPIHHCLSSSAVQPKTKAFMGTHSLQEYVILCQVHPGEMSKRKCE
jgi:hypothetical protein